MTEASSDAHFPSLFSHSTRKDWGVGVLAWEADGKRGYLFEDGAERTMASGFHQLMRKVEQPDSDQQAAYARLRRVLASRGGDSKTMKPGGLSFLDQLAKLHETYPAGLLDPKWAADIRGTGAEHRVARHRDAMIAEAQERLSVNAIDSLLSSQRFGQVWEQVVLVFKHTDLVPAEQLKPLKAPDSEQQRALAAAVRELLHGTHPYEQRFDRYLAALSATFGKPARWEMATALSALVHPSQQVCIEATAFRKQLKTSSSRAPISNQPSGANYTRFLGVARLVANKLAEQGEVPRDLWDVHDFIRITLKPASKARATRAKVKPVKSLKEQDLSDDNEGSESNED